MTLVPAGTVTFLYADIEGSTRLLTMLSSDYPVLLAEFRRIFRASVEGCGGQHLSTEGDATFAVFSRAGDAVAAALEAQRAIRDRPWPRDVTVRVRMGVHTGEPWRLGDEYVGLDVHRAARVGAAGYGGQILLSESAQPLVQETLPAGASVQDLGRYHLKDLAGPQRLFQVVVADLPSSFPPLKAPDRVPNNLPVEFSSFIGRDREIADIKRQLAQARLLTLTGPGGVGKTRLALRVAGEELRAFDDGVWLVELAACSDPDLVPQTTAFVFGLREQSGMPMLSTITDFLRHKRALLVLDNCEHVLDPVARLANTLLRVCPDVTVLATSREALRISGEIAWQVPPLSLPDFRRLPGLHDLVKYESVRLFIERAAEVHRGFVATEWNAPDIVQVCRRLDGIPLALELAAARVKAVPVEEMAAKLDDRFQLLTKGSRAALPQHQTLQAVMDWSYNLLTDPERNVFRQLSVFAGGFSSEAAEAVCAGEQVAASDVFDLVALLVDKSLVAAEEHESRRRYALLETVRQYARGKLRAAGEEAPVRERHSGWYLALAETTEPELFGTAQSSRYQFLEIEHDNFREALDWYWRTQNAGAGLRLAGSLYWFWQVRGYLREGRTWLGRFLELSTAISGPAKAKALYAAAALARAQRDYTSAADLGGVALMEFQSLSEASGIARCRFFLGWVAAELGHYQEAEGHLRPTLALYEQSGDRRGIGNCLNMLGELARAQGHYVSAAEFYHQALPLRRELGDERGLAISLHNLGYIALQQEDPAGAEALFRESLEIRQRLGHKQGIAYCLAGFAAIAAMRQQYARAATLWGAVEQVLGEIGAQMDRPDRLVYEGSVELARNALTSEEFAGAWKTGSRFKLEEAVEFALAD